MQVDRFDLPVFRFEVKGLKFVRKIDNVLFSHGGIHNFFVEEYVPKNKI